MPRTDRNFRQAPFLPGPGTFLLAVFVSAIVPGPRNATAAPLFAGPYLSFDTGANPGGLGPKTDVAAGPNAYSLAIGDLNGDGTPDMAVSNYYATGTLSLLIGNGDGTFQPRTTLPTRTYARSIVMADLDGDGKRDLAVLSFTGGIASVFPGKGDGTFGTRMDFGAGFHPTALALGDLNADGKPELAVAHYDFTTVSVLTNTGGLPVSVDREPLVSDARLLVARPNPARGGLGVHFVLTRSERVRAEIYDLMGRRIRGLDPGRILSPGEHELRWDGRDDLGVPLPAGVYLIRLRAAAASGVRRVVLLR